MSLAKVRALEPDTHHGVPVLDLHVDDPIPTPRAPIRYAVRIFPDLARYLLTFNHPRNRHVRKRAVARYSADMHEGLWHFVPESIVFSTSGTLENGQHRLMAVTEYGGDVWMILDFGWPDEIINAIDRGAGRTNMDAFVIDDIADPSLIAAAITKVAAYHQLKGKTRGVSGLPTPTAQQSLAVYAADPEGWRTAARVGRRVYSALDKGLAASYWAAAFRIIAEAYPDKAGTFFDAIADGTDSSGSATRRIGDWFRRRPQTATNTGDSREPLEIIIRGFNAHLRGKPVSFPARSGFELSRVK